MNKEKKKDDKIQNQTPKNIAFLVFYFIFFIVIVIMLRTGYKQNSTKITKTNSGYGYNFKLTRLENKNYHFIYTEEKNNLITIYEGDRKENLLRYKKSGNISTEYIQDYNIVKYKNPNTLSWEKIENPMIFEKFVNANYINQLLNRATYISKTLYVDSTKSAYNYEISTSTIIKVFENKEIDLDDDTNKISVVLDEEGKLKEINYDLTNYYKYYDPLAKVYKLSTKYSKYDEIKEIDIQ